MKKKVGLGTYLAYGLAQVGDTVPYCMFYTFFVYFLTDVVGLAPSVAGLVTLIAIVWDGITDPIVGYLSDHTKKGSGRRRPWMIASIFPLGLIVFLLFAPISFPSSGLATAYYVVISAAFWTLYTTYVIPYMSLGAEITDDYKGRNYIRMFNMIFGGLYMLLCTSGPTIVAGWSDDYAVGWGISGAIFGAITIILGVIGWRFTKGTETPVTEDDFAEENKESILTAIKETMQIKPYRKLCIATFLFFIGQIACSSAMVYLIIYNCGMTDGQQAMFWLVYAVAYTVMVPIGSALCNLLGKKKAFILGQAISIILCVGFFVIGINTYIMSLVYIACFQFGATLYWTTYLAFAYDCAEIDEYRTGKRREGSLCSIVSFAQKFGSAIGTYTVGMMLTFVGYDAMADVQTDAALSGILGLCTLVPAAGALLAIILMAKYPVTPEKYELILQAVKDKKAGKEVDETPFADCL